MFDDKTLLITGGTGSFGNAVLRRFLASGLREIRILSRDEKKQDDMRKRYNDPKLKFYIGDVRDMRSLGHAFRGVDYCYSRGGAEAGAVVRVPPDGGGAHQRARHGKRARRGGGGRGEARGVPEHGQGGVSDQRHGDFEGDDGKGDGGVVAQPERDGDDDLRDALRQRDGVARLGDSAVRRAGADGPADHDHRSGR